MAVWTWRPLLQNGVMAAGAPQPEAPWSTIVAEVRTALVAGQPVNREALAARIRAVASGDEAERALETLDRVLAVERARARLAQEPAPTAKAARPLRSAMKARPMLTANMDVRRQSDHETFSLAWDAASGIANWEVRVAERADTRSEYVALETRTLAPETTSLELPLTSRALRIHIVGRGRGGKLLRRAVISGLSRDNWDERWQKRASAS